MPHVTQTGRAHRQQEMTVAFTHLTSSWHESSREAAMRQHSQFWTRHCNCFVVETLLESINLLSLDTYTVGVHALTRHLIPSPRHCRSAFDSNKTFTSSSPVPRANTYSRGNTLPDTPRTNSLRHKFQTHHHKQGKSNTCAPTHLLTKTDF